MAAPYEEVRLAEMPWNEELQAFTYECPCGDLFQISREDLEGGEDVARCPSCSLFVVVRYADEAELSEQLLRARAAAAPAPPAAPAPAAAAAVEAHA